MAPVTAFALASPCVGSKGFKKWFDVSSSCGSFTSTTPATSACNLRLRPTRGSRPTWRPEREQTWHYLEVYLHSIADTQGAGRGFELAVAWDVALVTKVYDALLASWMDCEEEENGE